MKLEKIEFSKHLNTTFFTILLSILGLAITTFIIDDNISYEPKLPMKVVVTDDSDGEVDTLLFQHRIHALRDSSHVPSTAQGIPTIKMASKEFFFHDNPDFLVWILIISLLMTLSFALFPQSIQRMRTLTKRFNATGGDILVTIFGGLSCGFILYLPFVYNDGYYSYVEWIDKFSILLQESYVMKVIIAVPLLSGVVALMGMILISRCAGRLNVDSKEPETFKFNFNRLNQSLKFFLGIIAVLITFTVIATEIMRKAIMNEVMVNGLDLIPIEFVYLFGLLFTTVLAVFYLPVFFQLRNQGEAFINNRRESGVKDDSKISDFLQESVFDNLKVGFAILAPLISSVFTGYMGF